eukprot:s968_g4.t3
MFLKESLVLQLTTCVGLSVRSRHPSKACLSRLFIGRSFGDSMRLRQVRLWPLSWATHAAADLPTKSWLFAMVEYLKVGMRLDAMFKDDGKYYRATIAGINPKKKAPVKVHYVAKKADAWVSLDMIKFKALPKDPESEAPFGATIPIMARKYLLVKAKVYARLDPGVCPFFLAEKKYLEATKESTEKITWAIAHEGGCARCSLPVLPDDRESDISAYLAGILIQEMVWHRGASSLVLCGPSRICKFLEKCFSVGGAYEFAARSIPIARGTPEKPFEVNIVQEESDLPPAFDAKEDASCGHLAFDVGGIKTAAGKEYSKEAECEVSKEDAASPPFVATMPPLAKKLLVDAYLEATKECTKKIQWALPHDKGCLRYSLPIFPEERESDTSAYVAGVLIQEMIWQRRASSLILRGPPKICQFLQKSYSVGGAYEYMVKPMANAPGTPEKPFEVNIVQEESDLPPAFDTKAPTLLTSPPERKAHRLLKTLAENAVNLQNDGSVKYHLRFSTLEKARAEEERQRREARRLNVRLPCPPPKAPPPVKAGGEPLGEREEALQMRLGRLEQTRAWLQEAQERQHRACKQELHKAGQAVCARDQAPSKDDQVLQGPLAVQGGREEGQEEGGRPRRGVLRHSYQIWQKGQDQQQRSRCKARKNHPQCRDNPPLSAAEARRTGHNGPGASLAGRLGDQKQLGELQSRLKEWEAKREDMPPRS